VRQGWLLGRVFEVVMMEKNRTDPSIVTSPKVDEKFRDFKLRLPFTRGVYLLTQDTDDTVMLCRVVKAAVDGGVVGVQYRNKAASPELKRQQAIALLNLCAEFSVPLIVNDDVRLALEIGAAGVHLGKQDVGIERARLDLGASAIIGGSCYDDQNRAFELKRQGATYLAFGCFYPSITKPGARVAHPSLLLQMKKIGLPIVAIGGITLDNAGSLIAAGADLLAVISSVFLAPDPKAVVLKYRELFETIKVPS
jgi:thiamine-phosphate pyrophosphorylase